MELTNNLNMMRPDPIRHWVARCKKAGAENMFTIGVPDRVPQETMEIFSRASYDCEMRADTGYPPFVGQKSLRDAILRMEGNYGAKLKDDDSDRIYVTVGASQALQFVFSLFPSGSQIIVNTPCWGTIFNLIGHSGNVGVPNALFEGGRFDEIKAQSSITDRSKAVYINYPANPTADVISPDELKKMCFWAVENGLQIISDEPYKYIIFDAKKTPYESPVSFSDEIGDNVSLISSFSKIIKPDIRLGFIRLSPAIMESHPMIGYYFRNLSAGAPNGIQAGVEAVIRKDPKLRFLKDIIRGYSKKSSLVQKMLTEWGCSIPYVPAGTYMIFPTTHDGSDSEDWVQRMAYEKKCGFVPGTSFGGSFEGFEGIRKHFRMGFGSGMEYGHLERVLSDLIG